ncbi:hypothetical protein Tco_1245759 [Tanacetum coccineum]
MKARMAKKCQKLPFGVGRICRFLQNKKKKQTIKKEKPFMGDIPPACIEAILNICHLMALEIANEEVMRYMARRA